MPRPGPRPYECVRRAWHSDRHQPMRGSLIQEIFRVVSDAHSPSTRRNREWQEKLPCVVFKAEEIMYSKANSEAEYADHKTLWDRANDAIDTIIRRDDVNESQDLLQPCIEAALNLGCIPRRASRSQRHCNPGSYLSSNATWDVSHKLPQQNKAHLHSSATSLPPPPQPTDLHTGLRCLTPPIPNSACREIQPVTADASSEPRDSSGNPLPELSLPSWRATCVPTSLETSTWPCYGRVYPLYYGGDCQNKTGTNQCIQKPQDSVHTTVTGQVEMNFLHNFLGSELTSNALETSANIGQSCMHLLSPGCNLALSLGPTLALESTLIPGSEDDEQSTSSCYDKNSHLLPNDTTDDSFRSCSNKWSSVGEGALWAEALDRKRKATVDGDPPFHLKQKVSTGPLCDRTDELNL